MKIIAYLWPEHMNLGSLAATADPIQKEDIVGSLGCLEIEAGLKHLLAAFIKPR